jgi:hypothetical protein
VVVFCLVVVVGIVGLLGTAALWTLKKWGLCLIVVLCALNILSAAPGLIEAKHRIANCCDNIGRRLFPYHCAGSAPALPACFRCLLSSTIISSWPPDE